MKRIRHFIRMLVLAGLTPGIAGACASELVADGAAPEVLGSGYTFTEGPAADPSGAVYFTDVPNSIIHRWEPGQAPQVFLKNCPNANGMMFDAAGALLVCEGTAYRIMAYDVATKEGRVRAGGGAKRMFNEPNDIAADRHGGFYFTDPNYRHRNQESVAKEDVYYVASNGVVTCVSKVSRRPNGVLLSADGRTLFVGDEAGQAVYKYDVEAPGVLKNEVKWIDVGAHPDGMTLDAAGNLYVACGSAGVKAYSPGGKFIETVFKGQASNCCFGGPDFHLLFITARDKICGLRMKVAGVPPLNAKAVRP